MKLVDVHLKIQFSSDSRICRIVGEEFAGPDKEGVELTAAIENTSPITVFSDQSVFDALKKLRLKLEALGGMLVCFGTDEAVYPSGMQESMGFNMLAFRTTLGRPALDKDIVNIFESDESVKPVSVTAQEQFHERWIESLAHRAEGGS
jgi:hypothetical protein